AACTFAFPDHSQSSILIHGRVVSAETGDPLVHARVVIFSDAAPLPPIFADEQGRFASAPLPSGRYRLTATKAGYAATSVARLNGLSADDVLVRMPRSSAIAGRVLDRFGEPAAGVPIRLFSRVPDRTKLGLQMKTASTDDLGEYRFGGLPEGTYVVNARGAESIRSELYYPGVVAVAEAEDITLRPGDEKLGVDFAGIDTTPADVVVSAGVVSGRTVTIGPNLVTLAPNAPAPVTGTGIIRGRVTRADGLPIARATVSTQVQQTLQGRTTNATRSVQSGDDGQYEIT